MQQSGRTACHIKKCTEAQERRHTGTQEHRSFLYTVAKGKNIPISVCRGFNSVSVAELAVNSNKD